MLFRTQIIFCSSELRLHFRIAEVGSLVSLNRAWRAQVTYTSLFHLNLACGSLLFLEALCYFARVVLIVHASTLVSCLPAFFQSQLIARVVRHCFAAELNRSTWLRI